jgi:four helix bundle protein
VLGGVKAKPASPVPASQAALTPPARAGVEGASHEREKEANMLRVYQEVLGVVRDLKGVLEGVERRDPDLARQMRRAAASVALNIAEANGSRGRNRGARFHTALGSMRETLACLEVGEALGYGAVDVSLPIRIDKICGALYALSR